MARSERGAALVLALLVVALLMTLVLEFDRAVRLEHRAAGNYRDGTAAFYLARAGLAVGQSLLEEDSLADTLNPTPADDLEEPWAMAGGEVPLGRGQVRVSIVDEERFFPLNALTEHPDWVVAFRRLLRLLDADERLADAIADWIDEDENARVNGAENGDYQSLPTPYQPRNGPIESLDELRFIKGMTDELFGRLAPHVTAAPANGFKINLNTADPLVLRALHDDMTADRVERFIAERPIESPSDISAILGSAVAVVVMSQYAGLTSRYFTIEAEGMVNGIGKLLTIQIERSTTGQKLRWVRLPA
ncbi:MAG: type II secretion system minor pseudopilin GspK [Nitrospirota bacterium]